MFLPSQISQVEHVSLINQAAQMHCGLHLQVEIVVRLGLCYYDNGTCVIRSGLYHLTIITSSVSDGSRQKKRL